MINRVAGDLQFANLRRNVVTDPVLMRQLRRVLSENSLIPVRSMSDVQLLDAMESQAEAGRIDPGLFAELSQPAPEAADGGSVPIVARDTVDGMEADEAAEPVKSIPETAACSLAIQSQTELTFPADRSRTRIAVTEKVEITASGANGNVNWSITAGHGALSASSGNRVTLTAHDLEETTTVEAIDDAGCKAAITFSVSCNYLITKSKLKQIFTTASDARLDDLTLAFNQAFDSFFVDTCLRKAHFFAQVLTEVGSGANPREENMNYTPQRLKQVFGYFRLHPVEANQFGRTSAHAADQPAIGNRAYANRIGNGSVASGDGWRFRGRGYIQLTGRSNYTHIQQEIDARFPASGVDIITNFNDIISTKGGLISAMAFWSRNNLHLQADGGETDADVDNVTNGVNPGTRHPEHRRNHFHNTTKIVFKTAQCPRRPP